MKNKLFGLVVFALMIVGLTGCDTYKSYTFKVETKDNIEIKLQTGAGYDISSDIPFSVSKDGEKIFSGSFITLNGYNVYLEQFSNNSDATLIDSGNKNGVEYSLFKYEEYGEDVEYDYIIKVNDSNTGILIGSINSEESVKKAFERLTFSKVD